MLDGDSNTKKDDKMVQTTRKPGQGRPKRVNIECWFMKT